MPEIQVPTAPPSPHLLALAGVDLETASAPALRAEPARELGVVLSRSRDPARELFLERCAADCVPVVIRPSGGGAVVLAPGVVAGSLLAAADPGERFPEPYFRRFCAAVAAALRRHGAPELAMRGVSDLCVGERKVAGSSLRLWRGRVLFQVSLLVDPDVALFGRYLRAPSRAPAYRRGRPHVEFVTTLASEGCPIPAEEAAAALRQAFGALLAGRG